MVTFGCVKRLAGASFVRATFHRLYATGTMSSHQVHLPVSETSHLRAGSSLPELKKDLMRLYSMKFCPYAQRTRLVLAAKRIPNEVVNVNLVYKPDWFLARNPFGKVPILELDGQPVVYESLITADFLDEVYPEPQLRPADPMDRAQDRILVELFNKVITALFKLYRGVGDDVANRVANLEASLDVFEAELVRRGSTYFGGPTRPGWVDYMIWPWMERLYSLPVLTAGQLRVDFEGRFPVLGGWMEAMMADEAVAESFLPAEVHARFVASYMSGKPDYDIPV